MGNVVKEKSFAFAIRIVNLHRFLSSEKKEFLLSKQLLRSGKRPEPVSVLIRVNLWLRCRLLLPGDKSRRGLSCGLCSEGR